MLANARGSDLFGAYVQVGGKIILSAESANYYSSGRSGFALSYNNSHLWCLLSLSIYLIKKILEKNNYLILLKKINNSYFYPII